MASIIDDRGYNQGFQLVESTVVRMRRRADLILSEMDSSKDGEVLEIGCGTGEISHWLAAGSNYKVLGTDLCEPFIETAKERFQRHNLTYEVLDFNDPSQIKKRMFNYVVGNGILHHLYPTLSLSLKTIHALLKPGGKMIFMEPNIYNPYCAIIFNFTRKLANLEPDEMAFSRRWISKRLLKAGYSSINVSYKDFLVPGIPAFLIRPSITIGDCLERIPPFNRLSQSLFIVGMRAE
jgi:2-polyprenyl-3-methyl-5-hydroxy-6-metoxy-1,4-benzoquinol methylase